MNNVLAMLGRLLLIRYAPTDSHRDKWKRVVVFTVLTVLAFIMTIWFAPDINSTAMLVVMIVDLAMIGFLAFRIYGLRCPECGDMPFQEYSGNVTPIMPEECKMCGYDFTAKPGDQAEAEEPQD